MSVPKRRPGAAGQYVTLDAAMVDAVRGPLTLDDFARALGIGKDATRNASSGKPVLRSTWQLIAQFGKVTPETLLPRSGARLPQVPLPSEAALRDRVPSMAPDTVLDRAGIHELAARLGLFRVTTSNPHLSYTTGDISFWSEQAQPQRRASQLWAEMLARSYLLELADASHVSYATQRDLSHAARPVVLRLLQWASESWRAPQLNQRPPGP